MAQSGDGLFAAPGHEWRRVSHALLRARWTALGVGAVVVLVVLLVGGLLLPVPGALVVALAAVVVLGTPAAAWWTARTARRWGYAERDEDLFITHGALLRRLVVVPYGRMQYVDVHAGPLERLFGIASVHLHTAAPATAAHIPGLPAAEAARLRDRLTALGQAQAAAV